LPTRKEVTLPFNPTPKQAPFVNSSAMFKLGGGARGGGKSHCLSGIGVLLSFFYPGNTGYVGRANLTDFEKSTLPLILNLIPPELLITCNQQKHFIDILSCDGKTPSRIWYGEMNDPSSVLSSNLGWFFIDEAYEVPLETFVNLAGCLRGNLPDGSPRPYYGLLGSNPAPGWLMDTFPVLPEEQAQYEELAAQYPNLDWEPVPSCMNAKKEINGDYAYFHFSAVDNPFNRPGYVRDLVTQYAKLGPEAVSRYVYGVWDATMAGLVYQLEPAHLWNVNPGLGGFGTFGLYRPGLPVLLGGDPSNGAGIYAMVACQVYRGQLLVIDEFWQPGGTDEDARDWLQTRPWKQDLEDGIFDPAKPDSIKRLVGWGYPVRGLTKKKNVTDQINSVKSKMAVDIVTNRSELVIDATKCEHLVEEFRKRVYRNPSRRNPDARIPEQPVKAFDHLLNALEYLVYQLFPFGLTEVGTPQQRVQQKRRAYWALA
jgi:hypothetical protein